MDKSREIQRECDRYERRRTQPDRARLEAHEPQHDSGNDRAKGLQKWLSKVNHAVRNHHDEDRVDTQLTLCTVNHESSKKELKRNELQSIEALPDAALLETVVCPGAFPVFEFLFEPAVVGSTSIAHSFFFYYKYSEHFTPGQPD